MGNKEKEKGIIETAEQMVVALKIRKAEGFLEQYYSILKGVEDMRARIHEKYYSTTDISISLTERVQSSATGDGFSKALIDMLDEQKKLEEYCNRENKKMDYILKVISQVSDATQRSLIVMRYIDGRSWKYISSKMGKDISNCLKKIKAGKLAVADILERENHEYN